MAKSSREDLTMHSYGACQQSIILRVLLAEKLTFARIVVNSYDSSHSRAYIATLCNVPLSKAYLFHQIIHDSRYIHLADVMTGRWKSRERIPW